MTAVKARHKIEDNAHLLPYLIRIEEGVTWLHFEIYDMANGKMVNY